MIKVAHCIHGLGLGGAQKLIAAIVRGRQDESLSYFVYAGLDGVLREEMAATGATVRILPRTLPKFDPNYLARLARAMRGDRIDLVHTHLFGDTLHGYLASRLAGGLPCIMTLHIGVDGLTRLQLAGYRRLLRGATRAVACSRSVRRSFQAHDPSLARKVTAIPNGIEDPSAGALDEGERSRRRQSLGVPAGSTVLASIGRLAEQKGYRYLIPAFARACRELDQDLRLVFFGDGPLRRELESLAASEGAADRVVFAGFRPDIGELLAVVDAVVFSSLWEGLPLALLEAMAAGRCIVATAIPGIQEAVRDGDQSLLVPAGAIEPLGAALARVAAEPELRRRLGRAARRRFLDEYTAGLMVQRYEDLYREVHAATAPSAARAVAG